MKCLDLIIAPESVATNLGQACDQQPRSSKSHALSWRNHTEKLTTLQSQNMKFCFKKNQHSIFVFRYFHAQLPGKDLQTQVLSCNTIKLRICVKNFPFTWLLGSHWYGLYPFYRPFSPILWHRCQRVFSSCGTLAHARHAGRFGCLMRGFILMTMDNGIEYCVSSETQGSQPNPTHREKLKPRKYMLLTNLHWSWLPWPCVLHNFLCV